LFLFEAASAGSGKTLLCEIIGLIATGRELPVSELPGDNEEVRKAITAILLEGERLVLLDNAAATFGCSALDAALTSTTYKGRILGRSKRTTDLPADTVWFATGNNLLLRGDTHRRVIPCRLEPQHERPEERSGFRHPNLKQHVRERRADLVVAALTILTAHARAGRPTGGHPPWGVTRRGVGSFGTPSAGLRVSTPAPVGPASRRRAAAGRTFSANSSPGGPSSREGRRRPGSRSRT
jgi:hypothetical protein